MGWIDPALEWVINQWAIGMTAIAFLFNYIFHRSNKHLVAASFSVAAIYCIGGYVLEWVNHLPELEKVSYRYSARLLLYFIGLIILSSFIKRTGSGFVTYLTLSIYFIAMLLQLALHIDRNVIGLNQISHYFEFSEVVINSTFESGHWLLWDIYTSFLNASSVVLVVYFLVGESIRVRLWKL